MVPILYITLDYQRNKIACFHIIGLIFTLLPQQKEPFLYTKFSHLAIRLVSFHRCLSIILKPIGKILSGYSSM